MTGKCPHCQALITRVNLSQVTASPLGAPDRNAVAYSCPSCQTVLNVEIDPISLRAEIVSQTVEALLGALRK